MSENNLLSLTFEGLVATVTINREEQLNALNQPVLEGLQQIVSDLKKLCLGDNPYQKCRLVLIRGAGTKAFVAGADIKLMHQGTLPDIRGFIDLGQKVMCALESLPLPVIAVVDGFALGGGLELALACDLVVVTEKAKLGLPEVGLGLIPGFGGTQRLAQKVGLGAAKRVIFTGEQITGEEAWRLGIAEFLFNRLELEDKLGQLCKTIYSKAPLAIAAAKRAISKAAPGQDQGLSFEVDQFINLFSTKDTTEGLSAFVEKRKANFVGQ